MYSVTASRSPASPKYPARVKCALLGWMAFKDALVAGQPMTCGEGTAMSETAVRDELLADVEEAMRDVVDPELGHQRRRPGPGVRPQRRARRATSPLIDMTPDLGGLPADRRDRGPDPAALHRLGAGLVNEIRINWVWNPPWGRTRSPTTAASSCAPSVSQSRSRRTPHNDRVITVPAFIWRSGLHGSALIVGAGVGMVLGVLSWLDSGFWVSGVLVLVIVGTFYGIWMARRMARYWPMSKQLTGAGRVAVVRCPGR